MNVPVGTGISPGEATAPTCPTGAKTRRFDPNGYCWSHGYRCVFGCNSKTCTRPKEGHQREATIANTMGGSEEFKEWKPTDK
eukprot:6756168-Ditylum_brightwellii.AAC.1